MLMSRLAPANAMVIAILAGLFLGQQRAKVQIAIRHTMAATGMETNQA